MKRIPLFLLIISGICLYSCGPSLPEGIKESYKSLPDKLSFNVDVKPILSDKCFACHGPDKGKIEAGLQLHVSEAAYAELSESPGQFAIVPGKLSQSQMFHRIMADDENIMMPPPSSHLALTAREKAILIKWIEEGATYEPHWAFVKPQKSDLPTINQKAWPQNEIDYFVLSSLEAKGVSPAPEADKAMLLRRLSLDLTGLPPTLAEIEAFEQDNSPQAYEKQVDRLLQSPHFGEKLATDWMDVARYADTHGYQVDRYRDMSPWRDWVIQSFNQNRPYDEFLTWQLAGDLLPNATTEQILATGFNRLHQQNLEGGIVDEEFRVEYVADRTATLGIGTMALTLGCARCHDHKYDPISQQEFYELYSFFNNVNETGQISWDVKDIPVPTLLLPTEKQAAIIAYLDSLAVEGEKSLQDIELNELPAAQAWVKTGAYRTLRAEVPRPGLVARFTLDQHLHNTVRPGQPARMNRQFSKKEVPHYVRGKAGKGLLMDGDAWMETEEVGIYQRHEPFSIGIWVNIPEELHEGVIFHKNKGTRLHSYKGYHLNLHDDKIEVMLAHTWPDNAIVKESILSIPKNEWVHLMMTYDGSSQASGVKVFLNGEEIVLNTITDNLYKDIIFHNLKDQIYRDAIEPSLQIGARWRGRGIKGASVDDILVYNRELAALEVQQIFGAPALNTLIQQDPLALTDEEQALWVEYYLKRKSSVYQEGLLRLRMTRGKEVDSVEQVQEVMVMKEMETPRQAYVLNRGLYDAYGDAVFPNTPSSILPFPEEYPRNRLGLAQWLVHPDHPLTARVAVNRYWQHFFGRGIVRTAEDFGNQGELPSHPRLLDWLAVDFMEQGWDVKALHKTIVMSATYRQQSIVSDELREQDPDNVWLARGPSFRLTSEMMRDNALMASGLLNPEIGGKSVKPYQPEGLWVMNAGKYEPDSGAKLYRRSLYTIWKRTVPHPTQATFDQPERNECTVRRQKTNTPLQALVLMNDPTFIEASKKMGEEITRNGNSEEAISQAYLKLTGRHPLTKELEILTHLQQAEYEQMTQEKLRANGWLSIGEYIVDTTLDVQWMAANAIVASAIMNADATITRR